MSFDLQSGEQGQAVRQNKKKQKNIKTVFVWLIEAEQRGKVTALGGGATTAGHADELLVSVSIW